MQKPPLRIAMTWFQCRLDFGRQILLNIGLAQSVLRIFALTFVQTSLGAPGNGKRLTLIGLLKGL